MILYLKKGECISVTFGRISFKNSYLFLSSSVDSFVKTLVDNNHKILKDFEKEIFDNVELLNIVNGRIIITEDKYKNDNIKDLKIDFPEEIKKLEKA